MDLTDKLILTVINLKDRFAFPWNRYAKAVCCRANVEFSDKGSVRFLGRCCLKISSDSHCKIGNGFICRSGKKYSIDTLPSSKIVVYPNAILNIGDDTGMSNTVIYCTESVRIGSNVKIGAGTLIMDSNFHSSDWQIRRSSSDCDSAAKSPVCIEDDVFIGARVTICKGVAIGARSIIAAGSVVVKDIPSDCIAGGNPCKVVKKIIE